MKYELIEILSDGNFHSGESIARTLDITRSGVWKQINRLKENGIEIESIHGKGYRILNGLELLSFDKLNEKLKNQVKKLIILDVVGSTNSYILSNLNTLEDNTVLLAENQSSGRGRLGRTWQSYYAKSILMSIYRCIFPNQRQLSALSLAIGIAVAKVLKNLNLEVGLKWPNDIYVNGKKLGGILVEMVHEASGPVKCVIGLGLNCVKDNNYDMSKMTSIEAELNEKISRNSLISSLVVEINNSIEKYKEEGFSCFYQQWQEFDILKGKEISVNTSLSGPKYTGEMIGVDQNGALCLKINDKVEVFYGADVTLNSNN